jgi:AcrR family transcriptional regulator
MLPSVAVRNSPTSERLMDAALRLVAERGFEAASVGAIEAEAGLAPRSGALYKHFKSKDELIRAAVDRELAVMDELGSVIELLPLGDLRAELTLMARWNLGSLEHRATLSALVRREAARLPDDLLDQLYERLVARPYAQITDWLTARFAAAGVAPPDLHPVALVLVESMSSYHAMRAIFGRTIDDIDDERFIAGWVEIALATARRYGLDGG